MGQKKIWVVIPVHNRKDLTKNCLACFALQIWRDFQIIVVDDGSSDGTGPMIANEFSDVIVLKGDGNFFWTKAVNAGVHHALSLAAEDDYILTMNNDVIFSPDYLKALVSCAVGFPGSLIGSVAVDHCGMIVDGGVRVNWWTAKFHRLWAGRTYQELSDTGPQTSEVDVLAGRGTLIPLKIFKEIGLYNVLKLPHYGADYEFSVRARKRGHRLVVDYRSKLISQAQAEGLGGLRWNIFSIRSPNNLCYRWNFAQACLRWPQGILFFLFDMVRVILGGLRQQIFMLKISRVQFRNFLKNLVYYPFLSRMVFECAYRVCGRKPWSLGYSVYKYRYIHNVIMDRSGIFHAEQLPRGYGMGLDERAVECPWFFSQLKSHTQRILDAGSSLNHYDLLNLPIWQGRQLHITTLKDEGHPTTVIKPVYVYEDLRQMSYPDESFDAVACISTLEHVGMDNTFLYTDDPQKREHEAQAYLKAVKEMKRVLKEGGCLYLTMPYGKYRDFGWFQIFDRSMVEKVIDCFAPSKSSVTYYKYAGKQWNVSSQKDCAQGHYVDIHAGARYNNDSPAASQCVVCLAMTK